ncbi:MarR family transcriptional regulator [Isoptericola sp. 4D.3]|uniref:MarR family transcriptional regulator n=1 Tax=Isoptericola peretonis TaxID=2918523 RepID=A0ABT0J4C6_9MICO|nr:MarR family transcriptional regulator [Isoptericola sp. 4D.3]
MTGEKQTDPALDEAVRELLVLVPKIVAGAKRRVVPPELDGHDLAPRHLSLFAMLLDGPLTVNELASSLQLAPTTVSLMVTELTRQGLLRRDEDPDDRRRRVISVPPAHAPAIEAWLGDSARAWRQALSGLDPDQRALVVETIRAYERHLGRR